MSRHRLRPALRRGGVGLSGGGYSPVALLASRVAHWKLDEPSGARADSVGSNTLTDNNTVGSATGLVYALAADFEDANSESLTVASNSVLQMGDIGFWLAAWVKFESLNFYDQIAGKNTGGEEYTLRYLLNSTRWEWMVTDGAAAADQLNVTATPTTGVWYFLLAYHDAANDLLALSINGGAVATKSHTTGVRSSTNAFAIGGGGAVYMDGLIGPVTLGKNYVPTALDIAYLYNGGAGRA